MSDVKVLDGKEYPNISEYDCRPQTEIHKGDGIWLPIHSDPDENGRCVRCGALSHSEYQRRIASGEMEHPFPRFPRTEKKHKPCALCGGKGYVEE